MPIVIEEEIFGDVVRIPFVTLLQGCGRSAFLTRGLRSFILIFVFFSIHDLLFHEDTIFHIDLVLLRSFFIRAVLMHSQLWLGRSSLSGEFEVDQRGVKGADSHTSVLAIED